MHLLTTDTSRRFVLWTTALCVVLIAAPDSARTDTSSSPPILPADTVRVRVLLPAATKVAEPAEPFSGDLHETPPLDLNTIPAASEPDPSRWRVLHWMYRDAGGLVTHVATPRFALFAAGALAFTFGTAWADDEINDAMAKANRGLVKDFFLIVDTLGGPVINAPVVAAAGISLLTNNQRFQDAAWTSLQTLVYAGALGYVLKGIFGRDRPIWTDDTYAFFAKTGMNPVADEGNSSFPSGHAISSFGIITPWVLYYPSPFTYALYVIPTGTTLSRLAHRRHWATDVVVGTVIGITMGRWLVARHKRQQSGAPVSRVELAPADAGAGLKLTIRLD